MRSLTSTNGGWLRKTTAAGMVPLLLAQVLIALFWVPQTLEARSDNLRKMTWKQLPSFLAGEKRVTVVLEEGGAVRGEVIGVPDNGIHLGRVSMTTDGWRFPTDSDALVPRSSVQKIRLEKRRGRNRVAGSILGGAGAMLLSWLVLAPAKLDSDSTRDANIFLTTSIGAAVGGAYLGYRMGKREDVETTIITIVD